MKLSSVLPWHALLVSTVVSGQEWEDLPTYDEACNIGFCSIMGATLGGWGGNYTTVTSLAAFSAAVAGSEVGVVVLNASISGNSQVSVGSSKSIIGLPGSSLTGIGLELTGSRNVIIRNMKISRVPATQGDAISITTSRSVWIDHCDLSSDPSAPQGQYGNLVNIAHGSDYITITDNLFHDHSDGVNVGHSDGNGVEDKEKFHITFAGNYFKTVKSAISFRFGTGHIMNGFFQTVENGINTRMGADLLIESSAFEGAGKAILSAGSSESGLATVNDVDLGNSTNLAPVGSMNIDSVPYPYDWYLKGSKAIKDIVVRGAGQTLRFRIPTVVEETEE